MVTGLLDDLPKAFAVTPPTGKTFYMVIFRDAKENLAVLGNRGGDWESAPQLLPDLAMPEQRWGDYDISQVEVHDVPQIPKEVFWDEHG